MLKRTHRYLPTRSVMAKADAKADETNTTFTTYTSCWSAACWRRSGLSALAMGILYFGYFLSNKVESVVTLSMS